MNKFAIASLTGIAFLALTSPVFATEVDNSFTSCLTPNGSVSADFPDGTHGIAGQGSKDGHDTVYSLPTGNSMQCLCGTDGSGVQTNWLKVSSLSQDQVKVYESQGWVYVPSGSAWGLTDDPYLAQNLDFACGGSTGGGSTHGDGLSDGRSDGRTDGKSDGKGSIVQSATGFNLASTGNIVFILEVFGAGLFMTVLGLIMRKSSK